MIVDSREHTFFTPWGPAKGYSTHRDGRVALDIQPPVLGGDGGHPAVVEGGADLGRVLNGDLAARVSLEVLLHLVVAEHAVVLVVYDCMV